jgi:hypothetical protein
LLFLCCQTLILLPIKHSFFFNQLRASLKKATATVSATKSAMLIERASEQKEAFKARALTLEKTLQQLLGSGYNGDDIDEGMALRETILLAERRQRDALTKQISELETAAAAAAAAAAGGDNTDATAADVDALRRRCSDLEKEAGELNSTL